MLPVHLDHAAFLGYPEKTEKLVKMEHPVPPEQLVRLDLGVCRVCLVCPGSRVTVVSLAWTVQKENLVPVEKKDLKDHQDR